MATSTPKMTYKIGMRAGLDAFSDTMAKDTRLQTAAMYWGISEILLWNPLRSLKLGASDGYQSMKSGLILEEVWHVSRLEADHL